MWIESQDKKTLLKSKGITLNVEFTQADIPVFKIIDLDKQIVLGTYFNKNLVNQIYEEIKALIVSEYNYGHTVYSMPLDRAK